jgi:hypothetical protein
MADTEPDSANRCEKRLFCANFYTQNDQFTKTFRTNRAKTQKKRCVFRRSPASPSGSNNALGGLVVVRFLAILRHFDAANDHSFYQDSLGHTWENLTEKGWRFLQGNTRFRGKASLRRAACAEFWRDLRALLPEDEGGRLVLFMCQGGQVRCVCMLLCVLLCVRVCACVPASLKPPSN